MSFQSPSETFMRQLTTSQPRLHAFITSLLPDPEAAQDVLQNTNVVVWRSADQFAEGTDFIAWVFRIARHQVLSHVRDRGRDRHVYDESLLDMLAADGVQHGQSTPNLMTFLEECLAHQNEEERSLLRERYAPGASVAQMAAERGMTPNHLSVKLSRLRQTLLECVEQKLAMEARR